MSFRCRPRRSQARDPGRVASPSRCAGSARGVPAATAALLLAVLALRRCDAATVAAAGAWCVVRVASGSASGSARASWPPARGERGEGRGGGDGIKMDARCSIDTTLWMSGISVTWRHNVARAGEGNGATQGKARSIKAKRGRWGQWAGRGGCFLELLGARWGAFPRLAQWLRLWRRWLDAARVQALAGPSGQACGIDCAFLVPPPAVRFNTAHANLQPPVVGRRNFTPPAAPAGAPSVALIIIRLAMAIVCAALPN